MLKRYARDYIPTAVFAAACMLLFFSIDACQTNPVKEAGSLQQKAYALYGTFVVYEEAAAALVRDPAVPVDIKAAIRSADATAKPTADKLLAAAETYIKISTTLSATPDAATRLKVATANLQMWVDEAGPEINALVGAVKGKP